jgi:hypothetical protein
MRDMEAGPGGFEYLDFGADATEVEAVQER